ncbi:DUF2145 domain-containing protein [Litorilituus lipolyticus]|uniref:DUF2145 domain-containing protein n=2 Tax=Litorilituus lipolyticus TaxID=2491017 RepID=A0A502KZ10_9GAMM|nr:DUF2145 domain-containing protein [Litorilituus lipolyticus]
MIIASITTAHAGSTQIAEPKHSVKEITTFAKQVEKYAAKQGARAFIIARMGRPKKDLPKGISFTHTAIAVYSDIQLGNGKTARGYAIHNLYQNEGQLDTSSLVIDYPTDFFWGAEELKAGIIIPSQELQHRLIEAITSGTHRTVHNSNYSVIANPFNSQFQNCTEHTLDVINASIYQTTNIKRLKRNAKSYFQPQRVQTSRFKLMLGSAFMDDVTTKDHDGKVYTTTFTTIAKYLKKNQLMQSSVVFNQQGNAIKLI